MVVCSFICSVAFSAQEDDFAQRLRGALQNGGYRVMTVTRCNRDYAYNNSGIQVVAQKALELEYVNNLFQGIENVYNNDNGGSICFVVFNEYFFDRNLVGWDDFQNYMNAICEFTRHMVNAVFWVNFLHDMESTQDYNYNVMRDYDEGISDDIFFENNIGKVRNVVVKQCMSNTSVVTQDPDKIFANESFGIWNGEIVINYKKSTYYRECDRMLQNARVSQNGDLRSYCYGLGIDEKVNGLDLEHYRVSNVLHEFVYTDICWDVVRRVRYCRDTILRRSFFALNDTLNSAASRMKRAYIGEVINLSEYKLHIVQSASVNVYPHIVDLYDGQVLIHSDSKAFSVCLIKYPRNLRDRLVSLTNCMCRRVVGTEGDLSRITETCINNGKYDWHALRVIPYTFSSESFAQSIMREVDDLIEKNFSAIVRSYNMYERVVEIDDISICIAISEEINF